MSGDPWRITPEERVKHDTQFFQLKPVAGFITGDQAKTFLIQSGLPPAVLGHIWALADMNADGKMDKKEFSIAMHLIQKRLQGYELPKVLPPSITSDTPTAASGGYGMTLPSLSLASSQPQSLPGIGLPGAGTGAFPAYATMPRGGTGASGFGIAAPPASTASLPPGQTATASGEWGVPQPTKLKYTQMFNMHDQVKKGYLTGMEARSILTKTGLTHAVLAQVWNLADVDSDGQLTCEEFCLAMYLVDLAKAGQSMPAKLPPDLIPPSQRRSRSGSVQAGSAGPPATMVPPVQTNSTPALNQEVKTAESAADAAAPAAVDNTGLAHQESFGDLLGGLSMGGGMPPLMGPDGEVPGGEPLSPVTFEDKRKENFAKGQAELEKRRAMLREQQKKDEENRLAAERAEMEKREKIRMEQERKKQMEFERQLQKQREIQQEHEEHRRKALEQREAARRELERQRQMEWERQRREQLMAEKQREQAHVDDLRAEVSKLNLDLETLSNKKKDINIKIAQSRIGVTDLTKAIDGMRGLRDDKLSGIKQLAAEMETWTQSLCTFQAERHRLDSQIQQHNNSVGDTYKSVMHNHSNKQVSIERMKTQVVTLEKDTASKMEEVDTANAEFNEMNNRLNEIYAEVQKLQEQVNGKKADWEEVKRAKLKEEEPARRDSQQVGSQLAWASDTNNSQDAWSTTNTTTTTTTQMGWPAPTASPATQDVWAEKNTSSTPTEEAWSKADTPTQDVWGVSDTTSDAWAKSGSPSQDVWGKSDSTSDVWGKSGTPTNDTWGKTESPATDAWAKTDSSDAWDKSTPPTTTPTQDAWGSNGTASQDVWGAATVNGTASSDAASTNEAWGSTTKADSVEEKSDPFAGLSDWGTVNWGLSSTSGSSWVKPADKSDAKPSSLGTSFTSPFESKANQNGDVQAKEMPPQGAASQVLETLHRTTSSERELTSLWSPPNKPLMASPLAQDAFGAFGEPFGADPFAGATPASDQNDGWAASFQVPQLTIEDMTPASDEGCPGPGYRCYRALYQFEARNHDELTLCQDDIVWVRPDQTGAEPGWLGGQIGEREGWFPEAYVEYLGDGEGMAASQDVTSPVAVATPTPEEPSTLHTSESSSFTAVTTSHTTTVTDQFQAAKAEEAIQAQALYPWRAKKDNHLTFNPGDVITVHEQQDIWWAGEIDGKVGWFPKSYVKVIGGSSVARTNGEDWGQAPTESPEQPEQEIAAETMTSTEAAPSTAMAGEGECYVALYGYSSSEPTDLNFNQGEIITVTAQGGDWWTGTNGERSGMFPANYVKKMDAQPVPTREAPREISREAQREAPNRLSLPTAAKAGKKPEIASVLAPYQATGPEQLSLTPGQLIQIRKKSNSGWWEGELQVRGQKRKIGWFPANYVKTLGSGSARSTPIDRTSSPYKSVSPNSMDNGSRTETPLPNYPVPSHSPALEQVIALYPYAAQNNDELTFEKGSVINVTNKDDVDWWKGEQNGITGLFPSNYVSPLNEALSVDGQLTEESQAWNQGTYYNASNYENGGYYSNPDVMGGTEKSRQAAITELYDTEESYMADMSIVLEVFHKPMKQSEVVNKADLHRVFVNWKELIMCNTKFLKSLRVRKKMTGRGEPIHIIGDILCENLPHMTVYVRYCSCQLNAATLIQTKSENDPKFKEVMQQCQQDSRTKGMPISSFLLKPMQRITRYPLMIQKILKFTPVDHPDHQNLEEALIKANELCNQVNEGVREKENSDHLEWTQNHVICEGLPEKIVFNSVTNCLGPRKIMHSGTLYKAKSGKELVGFLFNDFMLLTIPQRSLGNVTSVFSLDSNNFNMQFKMYRTPIFLNEVEVKRTPETEADPMLFIIMQMEKRYCLKAVSNTERDAWVKKIETASKYYQDTERKRLERAHSLRRAPTLGRLLVVIMEGVDLTMGDAGKSDPYCEVSMGIQEHRTKVIQNTLNPRWNASMQFSIKDVHEDVLCITVYDRDLFTPNDFLGRTEIRIKDIFSETHVIKGPITKRMPLHEVDSGEIIVKLDLQLYENM